MTSKGGTTMKNEEIGKLLKELRIKHGLTQLELANKVNVTYQAVSRWEKGINTPNLVTLVALKDLYQISIDELLMQVKTKVEVVPRDFVPHWMIRFFLIPIILMVFSFGLTQFYLFLNVTQAMVVIAIFVGIIFSAIMAFIKVRHRGYFFLFVLGGLLLINGTAFLLNQRYFNLNEVPYLIEIETMPIQIDHVNQKPSHFRYDVDGEPYVLIYYEGYEGIYIHQIQEELEDSMTLIDTLDHSVDSITQLGDHLYISSYKSQTNGSVIFDFNIRTKSLDEFYASDLKLNVITSLSELYFYEVTGTIRDRNQVFYRWNGTDAIYYKTFGFDVLDMVYHPFYNKFYVSIY